MHIFRDVPLIARLLDLPVKETRVKVFKDEYGNICYLPQFKWLFGWHDNYVFTHSPSKLMWVLCHNTGLRLKDLKFHGLPVNMEVFENQQLKLDHFPFSVPQDAKYVP